MQPDTLMPQTVPHDRQAEEAVIGAALINPDSVIEVNGILETGDFYIHRHRWIWESILHLQDSQQPVDFLTVTSCLDQRGQLADVGGPAYLAALTNNTPSALHAATYAQIVHDMAIRRKLLEAANQIARFAYQTETALPTVIGEAEKAVFAVSRENLGKHTYPVSQAVAAVYEQSCSLAEQGQALPGLPTGFTDLDKILNGLQPSDLLLVAGRPGQGKTGWLTSVVKHVAQAQRKRVAFFSLEMSGEQLALRLLSQESGIDSQRLRAGQLYEDEWPRFVQAVETIGELPICLDDTPAITPTRLRSTCRKLYLDSGLDLIVVDYLQLMRGEARFDNRQQEVSYISGSLKSLAKELNVPVLAAAQLSRAVEQRTDKTPVLSDLRESGSLEMDADVVMFIHRPETYTPGNPLFKGLAEITVAKHRNGPLGRVELVFSHEQARFENAVTVNLDQMQ